MSQYIDQRNQEFLWTMFHKIPQVSSLTPPQKESMFKNAIGHFYSQMSPTAQISVPELQEWNKQTISHLVSQFRSPPPPVQQVPQMSRPMPQVYETPVEKTQRIFEEKQKQYSDLTAKTNLPDPNELFKEPNIDESTITNMDELIEQYQQDRQKDIPQPFVNTEMQTILDRLNKLEERMENLEFYLKGSP